MSEKCPHGWSNGTPCEDCEIELVEGLRAEIQRLKAGMEQRSRPHGGIKRMLDDLLDTQPCRQDRYDAIIEEFARLKDESESSAASEDAMAEKVKSLAPHGTCGCSYDKPGDACMHHSPQLMKMKAELAAAIDSFEEIANMVINSARDAEMRDIARAWLSKHLQIAREDADQKKTGKK